MTNGKKRTAGGKLPPGESDARSGDLRAAGEDEKPAHGRGDGLGPSADSGQEGHRASAMSGINGFDLAAVVGFDYHPPPFWAFAKPLRAGQD